MESVYKSQYRDPSGNRASYSRVYGTGLVIRMMAVQDRHCWAFEQGRQLLRLYTVMYVAWNKDVCQILKMYV